MQHDSWLLVDTIVSLFNRYSKNTIYKQQTNQMGMQVLLSLVPLVIRNMTDKCIPQIVAMSSGGWKIAVA